MDKLKEIYKKNKDIILYIFFGGCTTVVSFVVYFIFAKLALFPSNINTVMNSTISWIAAVIFAYVTNRTWVFESRASTAKEIVSEISAFFACRVATGVLEVGLMFVFVDKFHFNDLVVKIVVTFLVIILNYVASKLYVFKAKGENVKNIIDEN